MNDLQTFLTTGVFSFLICFVRIGTILMIMPGIGNTFVSAQVRLLFALALSFVLFPLVQAKMPSPLPVPALMGILLLSEFVIGFFIGTVARILMSALDTAGMLISMQASLANAQLFNPALASQGSLIGSALTIAGIVLLFVTNMYHLLILGMINSYEKFPVGQIPEMASLSKLIVEVVASSFAIGVQLSAPFIMLVLLMYVAMGVMSKLMPTMQVFMIAMPVQIMLALATLVMVFSAMMLIWIDHYEAGMKFIFSIGGGG